MKRRDLLAAAPVAVFLPAVPVEACAMPFDPAPSETPIAQAFRRWAQASARIATDDLKDAEFDRQLLARSAAEIEINSLTAETAMDALMKVCASSDFGFFGSSSRLFSTGWYDARRLLGVLA